MEFHHHKTLSLNTETPMNNQTYIVRVWLEPNPGGSSVWRASVLDSNTQERLYFWSADQLAAFLYESSDARPDLNLKKNCQVPQPILKSKNR